MTTLVLVLLRQPRPESPTRAVAVFAIWRLTWARALRQYTAVGA